MVSRRPTTILLEPDAPMWAHRLVQRLDLRFLTLWPQQPVQLWQVIKANLPDPTDWPGCLVYVSDVKKLGVSDGAAWRDAVGGLI